MREPPANQIPALAAHLGTVKRDIQFITQVTRKRTNILNYHLGLCVKAK